MEDEIYHIEGEFAFKSYLPDKLKVGMHFLTSVSIGILEPEHLFFTLEEVPQDEEMFMSMHGAPVHVFLVDEDEKPLADPKEIGWFNDGDPEDLKPITDEQITKILNDDDGFMDIECDENGELIYYEDKVIISYLSDEEEEEE